VTFATPILAAIVAGIVIPSLVILYFLKLRRRDMEVSSTLLWKKAIQDLQANAPFQKLRNNILLILQLLALIAALFAIAQPELRHRGISTARRIILIDRSASMNATDGDAKPTESAAAPGGTGGDAGAAAAPSGSPGDADTAKPRMTRLAAAKKKALELITGLKEPSLFDDKAEEAMVIAFDSSAVVVQDFTHNKDFLKQAIEKIAPSDAPSSLDAAYALARAYTGTKKFDDQVKENKGFVASGPGAAIHIFSDGRLPDADKVQTAPEDRVVYYAIGGQDAPNVAITGLRAERAFDNPAKVNIFISLQSTDTVARTIDAELTIDGEPQSLKAIKVAAATQPVGSESAKVEAPASDDGKDKLPPLKPRLIPGLGGVVVPVERMNGGIATVKITPSERDLLATDNVGYLTIPPAKRLSVVLVTNGNLFVKSALEGLNLSKFDVKTPDEFQQMLDKGQLAQYDVFVLDRVLPNVMLSDKKKGPGLPPGRSLVLGAVPPPPLGLIDEGPGESDAIAVFDRDHPVLQMASLDKISIAKSRKVKIVPDTPVKQIAQFFKGAGPAMVEITDTNLQAIVIPWDVADSDWPFDPGWVLFLAGSVLHLSDTQAGALSEGIRAGDTLSTRLPAGSEHVRLLMPGNESVNLEQGPDGTVSYGPIARTGMYTVEWQGQATPIDFADGATARRNVAVNLLDPYESDIGATPRLAMWTGDVQTQDERESDLTRKLWPYLLLGALAVMMLEWFIYNRKVAL
jgi:hypothetical protein